MKRFSAIGALAFLAVALLATPAVAGKQKEYSKVKGEVIKVEQQVKTANGGEFDRLTIRTRQGEEMQLHLGRDGACDGCFQQGDRIRARVQSADGTGSGYQVQSMKVRRGGEMYGYVNAGGQLVQERGGRGTGGGNGDRVRDRIHEPGSGDCPGCGAGQRGGAGQRTGSGSRGGGGRGGGS